MRAIVTGATNGIGEAVAGLLAADGHTVVLTGRDDDRLTAAARRIEHDVPGADLVTERADLAQLPETAALTERLLAGPTPDVVVSNAAVCAPPEVRTPEGIARVVMVNHVAPFVLLRALGEVMAPGGRLVVVGADPAGLAALPLDLDDLGMDHPDRIEGPLELRPFRAYALTKNMNAMVVVALAERLRERGVTVTGAHPGIIGGTGLSGEAPAGAQEAVSAAYGLDRSTLPDARAGADTPAWLATATEVDGVTGRFFVDRQDVPLADHVTDPGRIRALWEWTAGVVERAGIRISGSPAARR